MCGILLRVSHKTHVPLFLDADTDQWHSSDENYISKTFLEASNIKLSQADECKLKNIDELHKLNQQLNQAKNQIKVTEKMDARIQEIRERISELSGENIVENVDEEVDEFEALTAHIAKRGPNFVSFNQFRILNYTVQAFSSVLSLRKPFTPQPISLAGLEIQFNGELYNSQCMSSNDTEYVCSLLTYNISIADREEGILKAVQTLRGEFALSILDTSAKKVYFCRDNIGRRSLTFKYNFLAKEFILSSVASTGFQECDSKILHVLSLEDFTLNKIARRDDFFKTLHPGVNLDVLDHVSVVTKLEKVLEQACNLRQSTIHPQHALDTEANLAILFSGGLDCTVLAALIARNRIITEGSGHMDLLTVGFENTRTGMLADQSPDRMLSKKSWFHLSKLYNTTASSFRLVEINVSYKEWLQHRQVVKDLMYPACTEMDLSIAIAFYFASRGGPGKKWQLNDKTVSWDDFCKDEYRYATVQEDYISRSKVLFSGLGADEIFAGYSRHEAVLNELSEDATLEQEEAVYSKLNDLLVHDVRVIETRNLGRDDRVISTWGKELRYPYLDEDVVAFVVNEVGPKMKMYYQWETRITKKMTRRMKVTVRKWILRQLARKLDLDWVSGELKRAIQFGAKSAKMEIGQGRAKGTDVL